MPEMSNKNGKLLKQTLKWIDLNEVLQIENYKQSLTKWVKYFALSKNYVSPTDDKIPSQQRSNPNFDKIYNEKFNQYIQTIKPVVNGYCKVCANLSEKQYGFFSDKLNEDNIQKLLAIFDDLQKYQILLGKSLDQKFNQDPKTLADLQSQSNLPVYKSHAQYYKMDLNLPPQNQEIIRWGATLTIEKFKLVGKIIEGKGIGRKQLGMPTANVDFCPKAVDLSQYPTGIYVTTVKLEGKQQIFLGATSLGTNPHYEDEYTKRILETYIVHDFGTEMLYGLQAEIQFHELIRFQYKFKDFSSFLNGMRNDIEVTKSFKHLVSDQKIKNRITSNS